MNGLAQQAPHGSGYTYIYRQIVGQTLFYLSCLQTNLNEIGHEGGPLDPNDRKNTTVQLP